MYRFDLHSHSSCSDGTLTPTELVKRAIGLNLAALALTDHDSLNGISEGFTATELSLNSEKKFNFISGVEISTIWNGLEIHMVGLNFSRHPLLDELLQQQAQKRIDRAKQIAHKLEVYGFQNVLAGTQKYAKGDITRAHFAQFLVEDCGVTSIDKAFKKFLSKGKKAYVTPNWVSLAEAVLVINSIGGISVLAHPLEYDLGYQKLDGLISYFKQVGGDAIEVARSNLSTKQQQKLRDFSHKYDLLQSVGSDFHRPSSWHNLGKNLNIIELDKPITNHPNWDLNKLW